MRTISNTFSREQFYIEKVRHYKNNTSYMAVIRLNRYQYEIPVERLKSVLSVLGFDAQKEMGHKIIETIDDRPLWKKDMDLRMGRTVDFRRHSAASPTIPEDRLLYALKENIKNKGDEEICID